MMNRVPLCHPRAVSEEDSIATWREFINNMTPEEIMFMIAHIGSIGISENFASHEYQDFVNADVVTFVFDANEKLIGV